MSRIFADTSKKEKDPEDEEEEYIKKDPIAKNQFNYNKSTCFSHNHPEISVEENTSEPVQVAPGQGKIPNDLLQEEHLDAKSFPCFFPDGKNGKDDDEEEVEDDSDEVMWLRSMFDNLLQSPKYLRDEIE